MQTLSEIRALLDERGLRPRHRFGQNFLHDHQQIRKLLDAADVVPDELILEVGPGTGVLSEALLERGVRLVTCEIDRDLAGIIRTRLGDRLTLIEGDCLDRGRTLNPEIIEALGDASFNLVANLPYQIASPLMATLALHHPQCRGQFITIQREVGDRLNAVPGTKAYGPLGIIIQSMCTVRRIGIVPATCFWPAPKVTSAMLALQPREGAREAMPGIAGEVFARFVTVLFSKRRKQLGTIFGRDHDWPTGITPDLRPDVLSVPQLQSLCSHAIAGAWWQPS
jgi:16S rRNA (adenine1518-N6/adenine1519-N6)-dimethyltransferase